MLEKLRIVIVGRADHGKSTLIGRLLNEAGALPEDRVRVIAAMSKRRGVDIEWAFVTDALKAERDDGSTIDTSEAVFRTERRSFVIIDAPGQDEFQRNMVTGAASADLAVAVIDATADPVSLDQTRRDLYLLGLLGVRRLIVVINKMDRVDYAPDRFAASAEPIRGYLRRIDLEAIAIIPISARHGEMIVKRAERLDWYQGPTLVEALDGFEGARIAPELLPLRFSVQDVYKFDERRILAGRVDSGVLRVGDALSFAPGGATAKIASIEDWNQPVRRVQASAGDTIGITLDQRAAVERGAVGAPATEPIRLAAQIHARIFWLAPKPLSVGQGFGFKLAAAEYPVSVRSIAGVIDVQTLEMRAATKVETSDVAEIILAAAEPIPVDRHAALPRTGRAVLVDGADALGGALVIDFTEATLAGAAPSMDVHVSREERERRNRHRGAVLWMTGLPGSGKSTLATGLERALFEGGMHAVVLDGDNIRQGLSRDLGFDPTGRSENTRRVAEAAKLLADVGNIVIAALTSPFSADRAHAREIVGNGFAEIYVHADLVLCEARDPKGLYARARRGEINAYTGIDSVYQIPTAPDLEIDTGRLDIAEAIDRLIGFVDARFHDPRIDLKLVEPEWSV